MHNENGTFKNDAKYIDTDLKVYYLNIEGISKAKCKVCKLIKTYVYGLNRFLFINK